MALAHLCSFYMYICVQPMFLRHMTPYALLQAVWKLYRRVAPAVLDSGLHRSPAPGESAAASDTGKAADWPLKHKAVQ